MKPEKMRSGVPRTDTLIILVCLAIIGAIVIIYPLIGKTIGLDLLGTMSLLFVIILALLDSAGVKVSKAAKILKFWEGKK